jgi:3-deoxy-D-manno-octulosonic acid (KDO) 8-phosphate synthase
MQNVVEKARAAGNDDILVCERGASFGYNNLVSDMRSLAVMRDTGCPVVFDATHSVQLPGGQGTKSGGQREFVPVLARAAGNDQILVCERGASFGYNNLVSDMRSLSVMRETGCPVVFDATHSVQLPGGQGTKSGGQREFVPVLARAAVAVGVAGVFMETHPDPDKALSDGPNAWPLGKMEALLETLMQLDDVAKKSALL